MTPSGPRSMVTEHISGARRPSAAEPGLIGLGDRGLRDLTSIRIFARVVELQSFSEVARRSGVMPATISKHVSSLEAALGARLINRTTRRLFITEAGQRLYEHCVRVLQELDAAESELAEIKGEPAGPLHVTAPLTFGIGKLSPRLPEFLKRYPKVSLDLDLSIEKIDLFRIHPQNARSYFLVAHPWRPILVTSLLGGRRRHNNLGGGDLEHRPKVGYKNSASCEQPQNE